jgi:adenylate kinase
MTIFLGGVHGVGKTYLGRPVAQKLNLIHKTASELIQEERGRATWNVDRRVTEVNENQAALIASVRRLRNEGPQLLLDGHFVLKDTTGSLIRLQMEVFQQLELHAIIVLEAPPGVIVQRLSARTGEPQSLAAIIEFAQAEREHADKVSRDLHIATTYLKSPSEDELYSVVAKALNPG